MSNPVDEAPATSTSPNEDVGKETAELFGVITLDITYMKNIQGLLRVAEIFLSLIAFICVASSRNSYCDLLYAASYNFFEFVSISAFLSTLIIYLIYVIDIHTKLFFKFVPWKLADGIWCVVYTIMFFIAACVVAANYCFQGANQAGAAFGFFATFAIAGDGVLTGLQIRAERMSTTHHSSPANLPGQTLEQY